MRTGSAFVFVPGESGWVQQGPMLVPHASENGEVLEGTTEGLSRFGYSVALSANGSTALIGAPQNRNEGAAWVYTRGGEAWQQGQELQPAYGTGEESGAARFGESVALAASGSAAIVGAPNERGAEGVSYEYASAQVLALEAKEKLEAEELKEQEEDEKEPKGGVGGGGGTGQVLGGKEEVPPAPKAGFYSIAQIVKGGVFIESPRGSGKFRELKEGEKISNGNVIDATKGKITIKLEGVGHKIETVTLYGGIFRFNQRTSGQATFTLVGGNTKQCKKAKISGTTDDHDGDIDTAANTAGVANSRDADAQISKIRNRIRRLWASGHGSFTTRGSYASGAVLGTRWLTIDYCEGTEIRVFTDKVLVTNYKTHKKTVVRAGHSIFIPR